MLDSCCPFLYSLNWFPFYPASCLGVNVWHDEPSFILPNFYTGTGFLVILTSNLPNAGQVRRSLTLIHRTDFNQASFIMPVFKFQIFTIPTFSASWVSLFLGLLLGIMRQANSWCLTFSHQVDSSVYLTSTVLVISVMY